ncbi:hypothetical protein AB9F29_12275 [Falsihalocynthiibacter sp. S25ZX9]
MWRAAKISVDVIAERLGRNRSTVFRNFTSTISKTQTCQKSSDILVLVHR